MEKIRAKKSLGQNFLKDESILNRIADSISTNNDLIIEIGPGMGALTKKLVQKNSFVLAYEIDERMKSHLSPLENEKTKVIYKDFLQSNIKQDIQNISYNNTYILANIPYYITTPIIQHILDEDLEIKAMTLLVQKEVAERLSAKPKTSDYGAITVYLNCFFEIEKLFNVPNTCFDPVPKVDSAVISLTKKEQEYNIQNKKDFFKFITECFSQKRKTLKNNLKAYDWKKIIPILEKNQLSENCRAEELSLEVFLEIYQIIGN